ncbi:hypothetical protein CYR55_22695, partial [Chimaeribacter californicus]
MTNIINLNATVETDFFEKVLENTYTLRIGKSDNLHEVVTEDGLSTDVYAWVELVSITGTVWAHYRVFGGGFEDVGDDEEGYHTVYVNAAAQASGLMKKM